MVDKQAKAIEKLQENDLEAAAKLFIEYTEENPTDPVGYINVGNILFQLQQVQEAERFFLKAVELDNKASTAFYGLGNLYYEEGMHEHAEKMFAHCLSLGLEESDVYFLLGMTHVKREQLMLAIPFLQRSVEIQANVDNLFQYGLALAKLDYPKEAEQLFLQTLEENSNHADALYNLGILAFQGGDKQMALHYLKRAIQNEANHSLAMDALQNIEAMIQRDEQ